MHNQANNLQSKIDGLLIAAYSLLTIIYTWPLLLHFNTHVLSNGSPADNLEYVWKMWWVPQAIFERGISPWFHPDVYVPFGYPMANGEMTPVHTFGLLLVTRIVGEVAAYNLAGLASTVISGWITYRLARRWLADHVQDRAAIHIGAFFAGAVFAFSPFRLTRLGSQMPLIGTGWIVLTLLGLDRWLVSHQLRDAILMAIGFSFAALSSWYYGYILGLTMPVYLIFRVTNWREILRDRHTYLTLGLAASLAAGIIMPFLLPYLRLQQLGGASVPLADAMFWAASPLDYLLPNIHHPLWGDFVRGLLWPQIGEWQYEFALSIGWVPLLFVLWAWRKTPARHWKALKWMMLAAFILSLGPALHIGRLTLPVPLPVMGLRYVLPGAGSLRSWGRFGIIVLLGTSLLAGAGLTQFLAQQKNSRRVIPVSVICLGLLFFEFWGGPRPLTDTAPRPVDEWLAAQSDDAPIMQYPLGEALSGPAMFYTKYHHHPVVYGYGTYLPLVFRERHPELLTFPDDAAIDQLSEWGVHYVLVDQSKVGTDFSLADVEAQPRLTHIITLENQAVYQIED